MKADGARTWNACARREENPVERSDLYRKESMDRIQSPEQLNDYLRMTNPSIWVVLSAVIVLLAGLLIWSAFARIDSHADGMAQVENGVMTVFHSFGKLGETVEKTGTPFTDVPKGAYYEDAVDWGFNAKPQITDGNGKDKFMPEQTCTRGQVVTFLWRAVGCPEPKTRVNPFTDVKEDDYFYKPVLWAIENGVTEGTSATTFSPVKNCTNAHILTFLYRAVGAGEDGWYEEALNWAGENEIILGSFEGAYDVKSDCPRKNVVQFLYLYSEMNK